MFISILSFQLSNACICEQNSFHDDYQSSDIIFIGKIIEASDSVYLVKIIEELKGTYSLDTIEGNVFGSCSVFPTKGELWLFYGSIGKDGIFYTSQCSSSRSFNNTYNTNGYKRIVPPFSLDERGYFLYESNLESIELQEFHFEIYTLRHFLLQEQIQKITKNKLDENDPEKLMLYLIIIISMLVNISILIFIIYKKNLFYH